MNSINIDIPNLMKKSTLNATEAHEWVKNEKDALMMKTASFNNNTFTQSPYPSPFLNLSDTQIPRTTSEIFEWCKYYYTFDPLITGAVNALAMFPITEIYFEDKENAEEENKKDGKKEKDETGQDTETLKFYKKMFFEKINIYKLLVEIGIDYYLYGNCFIFGETWKNSQTGEIEWKRMTRLDPSKMIIDHNPATGGVTYKWKIPAKIVGIINKKAPKEEYDKIPDIIKEAVKLKGAVVLNPKNIFHFARPSDSMGDNTVWGTPVVANVLKLLMYRNTLRQAQEAIAREHIVPFRVYYLQPTADVNPNADWSKAAGAFATELMKSVRDPNHKVVSPVPVGLVNVGGEGRALMLTAEIEQVQSEILAGMNLPREFIFGGVSYSGSSISLKILENNFITYRLLMEDFVQNFCIKQLAVLRGEWKDDKDLITIKFNDLKMQDDVQQKQLIISLNSQGKIPDSYMFQMLGLQPDKIKTLLDTEAMDKIKSEHKIQEEQMRNQFKLQLLQMELQKQMEQVAAQQGLPTPPPPGEEGGQAPVEGEQMPTEGQAPAEGEQAQESPQGISPEEVKAQEETEKIQQFVINVMKLPESQREHVLSKLPEAERQKVNQMMAQMVPDQNTDMRPMPEQLPPRRDSIK